MLDFDNTDHIVSDVKEALAAHETINIVGGNSKSFLGRSCDAKRTINMTSHSGVVSYEPTELVVTVRAGTSTRSLKALLHDNGQMMPFEPPLLNDGTIGGVLACGLSGPARMFAGSARDYVLGMRVVNGRAQALRFGGEVMKNVAGYDAARLQVGAFGTLGVLLETSMKVLPLPESVLTIVQTQEAQNDNSSLIKLLRQPLPLSASAIYRDKQYIRLSGSASAVKAAASKVGGEVLADGDDFWHSLNEMTHPFFTDSRALWRVSIPEYAQMPELSGDWMLDWAGAQRWLKTDEPAQNVFEQALKAGGHATCFSAMQMGADVPLFQPLSGAMQRIQAGVRKSFDPQQLFNRGRFHDELESAASLEAVDSDADGMGDLDMACHSDTDPVRPSKAAKEG